MVLIVLDGFGINPQKEGNAIEAAKKPNFDDWFRHYPWLLAEAAEQSVGLNWGEVGNSEVGHTTIGSGQIIYQNLPRINISIEDKSFFKNEALLGAVEHVRTNNSKLHLVGLVSNGGVHSHIDHLFALLDFLKQQKIKKNVYLHAFTDGRDTDPAVADKLITMTLNQMKKTGGGEIASLAGRYFAMDRNNNWPRTAKVYRCLTRGEGVKVKDPLKAIKDSYAKKVTDEQLEPMVISGRGDEPLAKIEAGDAVIFFNFREDRARQLAKAFVVNDFKEFDRGPKINNLFFVTMTEYEAGLPAVVAWPPQHITKPLAKILAEAGLKQLHIAETEKYAHVTYFFNGGAEEPFKNEERVLIPSPDVETYDLKPAMRAKEITDQVLKEIAKDKYDFIVMNYANADMVGHTGKFEATVEAIQALDREVKRVVDAVLAKGGAVFITADHGNAEVKVNILTGDISKEHTANFVPLFMISTLRAKDISTAEVETKKHSASAQGLLADVAPTILD